MGWDTSLEVEDLGTLESGSVVTQLPTFLTPPSSKPKFTLWVSKKGLNSLERSQG